MTYKPCWTNASTQRRTQKIIEYLRDTIGLESRSIHSSQIRRIFGDSKLGRYLKNMLLITVNDRYEVGHSCKKYSVNTLHLNRVAERIGLPSIELKKLRIEQRFQEQEQQIESGQFEYNLGSDSRLYNGLQYIPREDKIIQWSRRGYCYDYDIESCAPTLLLQRYYKLKPAAAKLCYLEYLIEHKQSVRDQLCVEFNLGSKSVKSLLNAIIMSAPLSHNRDNKILRIINNNHYIMRQLKLNEFIQYLIKDIRKLWQVIGLDIERSYYYTSQGVRRKRRLTGRDRTDYYKRLEGEVMKSVRRYMNMRSARVFLEHDGFRSDMFFTPNELEYVVRSQTGYEVKFSWSKIEQDRDM